MSGNVYASAPSFLYSLPVTSCTAYSGYSNYQCHSDTATTAPWSGIIDGYGISGYPFSSTYFNDAAIEYYEPTPPATNTCNTDSAIFWAGLGGVNVSGLAQDGTLMGVCGATDGSFWFEMLPDETGMVVPYPAYIVAAGDTMWAQLYYVNSTTMAIYMKDVTTGAVYDPEITVTTSVYDGATAEAIAERPSISNTPVDLEDYGTLSVIWDYATGGSTDLETSSRLWNFLNTTMYNGSDELSYVSTLPVQAQSEDGSFVTTWLSSS